MSSFSHLWHDWQTSPEIRTHAESWLAHNAVGWVNEDDHHLYSLFHKKAGINEI